MYGASLSCSSGVIALSVRRPLRTYASARRVVMAAMEQATPTTADNRASEAIGHVLRRRIGRLERQLIPTELQAPAPSAVAVPAPPPPTFLLRPGNGDADALDMRCNALLPFRAFDDVYVR